MAKNIGSTCSGFKAWRCTQVPQVMEVCLFWILGEGRKPNTVDLCSCDETVSES